MVGRTRWRVHQDMGAAVDRLLQGQEAGDELRVLDAAGGVQIFSETEAEREDAALAAAAALPER